MLFKAGLCLRYVERVQNLSTEQEKYIHISPQSSLLAYRATLYLMHLQKHTMCLFFAVSRVVL